MSQMRWALADGWTITRRDLLHWARQPIQLVVGLLFPVLMVLMFGYLLGGAMSVSGGGDYREFLMPGMFAMTMVFGIETTFAAVATDAARGVTDRFRSMPMSSSAVVAGRAGADLLGSVAALAVLLACGLAVGWRPHEGPGRAALAVLLLLALRFAVIWVGIYLALLLRSPQALVAVQILVWPVAFFSSALAPPQTMPAWLGAVAEWNPLSATVSATRELFGNHNGHVSADSWAAQHGLLMATLWPALLVAVFFPLSVAAYRRLRDR
jgi:ABC transporter DrrB family efflux protein